ncbi:hypothetical protein PEDI_25030 [Persicobacter diffluens]|uniref:DUF1343 domain-containing protein n=2 Tax=Persicobacter diffluens TaxID=981 RepID=A0AAN4VZJ4_9BACT|nr:hypothetical protein PEDI_25030 [Persicobacter diffluens]
MGKSKMIFILSKLSNIKQELYLMKGKVWILCIYALIFSFSCKSQSAEQSRSLPEIKMGASQTDVYFPFLEGKQVGLVVNQTSIIKEKHLVDFLIKKKIEVSKIFAPEHGFRGDADAGEKIEDGKDKTTGLPVLSLYGKSKKPSPEMLNGIEVMVFDIQDVGVRFYTYISTLHLVMEACAEQNIPLVVLDRPNPNGDYVDGPVLEEGFESFVGMHPIPIVHGLTVGELSKMINGEKWLKNGVQCDVTIVPMEHYSHKRFYDLPVKPSPNLPNYQSIRLYPSLCLFEGTTISAGRGTMIPFQIYGHPDPEAGPFSFTPRSIDGMAKYPKFENQTCYGYDLREDENARTFSLEYLLDAYFHYKDKENFFLKNKFFDKLAGSDQLRKQIKANLSEDEIRLSWQDRLTEYKKMRKQYLLYPDFEL